MARTGRTTEGSGPELSAEQLLALALARPTEALAHARNVLSGKPSPWQASVAHQAVGVVMRDFGDIDEAVRQLRAGLRLAIRAGAPDRVADVRGTLGVAQVMAGRTGQGLALLERALAARDDPAGRGHDLIRRSWVLWSLGRFRAALADADEAVTLLAAHGDPVWEARAVQHRAMAYAGIGALVSAEHDYQRAEVLFARTGQWVEYADARQERGAVAFARGDLPAALARIDEAQQLVDGLGVFEPELVLNKCAVLLTAGLVGEARQEADAAVARSLQQRGSVTRRAELTYTAALTARADGDLVLAETRSREALAMFRRQGRPGWSARTELVLLQTRYAAGERSGRLLGRAGRLAGRLAEDLAEDAGRAAEAHLLAGRLALELGRDAVGRAHLASAGSVRGADLHADIAGHLARALMMEHDGRTRAMLAACAGGLGSIDAHLRSLGATELRAEATALGAELATIALRHAVRRSDPALLLSWSERWRSVAIAVPPVRPPAHSSLISELAALRGLTRRLEQVDVPPAALVQERRRHEDRVRRIVRGTPGAGVRPRGGISRQALLELHGMLGSRALVELIDLDGVIRAVLVHGGRVRGLTVGPSDAADRALEHALFALRRIARGRAARAAPDTVAIGARLERCLLGDLGPRIPEGAAVVIVPTGRWHAVPWSMMPSLAGRPVSVAASAAAWMRAAASTEPAHRRVVVLGGPGLTAGEQEVRDLAALHRERRGDVVVLAGRHATVDRALAAMDGAWLVHVAAHGRFRADSPLFSSVGLHDGPLTVYDLERLAVAPHRVVLSSCDSARGGRRGADELLGLVSALIALGCAGVLGSVVPVDDPATAPLMIGVHRGLLAGLHLPAALAAARDRPDGAGDVDGNGDGVFRATADSFVALGV